MPTQCHTPLSLRDNSTDVVSWWRSISLSVWSLSLRVLVPDRGSSTCLTLDEWLIQSDRRSFSFDQFRFSIEMKDGFDSFDRKTRRMKENLERNPIGSIPLIETIDNVDKFSVRIETHSIRSFLQQSELFYRCQSINSRIAWFTDQSMKGKKTRRTKKRSRATISVLRRNRKTFSDQHNQIQVIS